MILRVLAEREGEVLWRDDILEKVWGDEVLPSSRTVDNFILRLRKRFEPDPEQPAVHPHGPRRGLPVHRRGGDSSMSTPASIVASGRDLFLDTIAGRPTPRRPLWVMRQAGRYLPEYRALRAQHSFEELSGNAELAAQVTMQPLARFPLDAAIIFADLMTPVEALGLTGELRSRARPRASGAHGGRRRRAAHARSRRDRTGDDEGAAHREAGTRRPPRVARVRGLALVASPRTSCRGAEVPASPSCGRSPPATRDCSTRCSPSSPTSSSSTCTRSTRRAPTPCSCSTPGPGCSRARRWTRLVRPHIARFLAETQKAGKPRILFVQDASHLVPLLRARCPARRSPWTGAKTSPSCAARSGRERRCRGTSIPRSSWPVRTRRARPRRPSSPPFRRAGTS